MQARCRSPPPTDSIRSLLRDDVYVSLRDAIVDGTFAPGERLRDPELEQWLGVSRTPIGEALLRLERSGLVIAQPGRATTVAPSDTPAVLNAQQLASAMHELAARLAVPRLSADDIGRMEEVNARFDRALRGMDVEGALHADDDFPCRAGRGLGQPDARDVLELVTPVIRRAERQRFSTLAARDSVAQHQGIIAIDVGRVTPTARQR